MLESESYVTRFYIEDDVIKSKSVPLAVFLSAYVAELIAEGALNESPAERRFLPIHDGVGHASGDYGYCDCGV